jgi:hypothetical protein
MLQGMTNKNAEELVPLARSWLHAPNMKITSGAYTGGIYNQSERAYLLEAKDPATPTPCSVVLEASEDSPLINPAIIIQNWGSQPASCTINGKLLAVGKDFRQGIRKGTNGDDLILWIKLEDEEPVNIILNK